MKIVIPTVPKSLNHLMTLHWSQRYRYGKQMEKTVWAYCVKAKQEQHIIWKKFSRVEITFVFDNNRRHDVDNYTGGFKKGLDSLVLAGLIDDDSYQSAKITYEIKKGKPKRTEIVLSG